MSAPFLDLSSYLQHLEAVGRLRRVAFPVDKDRELACIARLSLESHRDREAYALRFDNVRGHAMPVAVNLYSTLEMYAAALGLVGETGSSAHGSAAVSSGACSPGATPLDLGRTVLERWALALDAPLPPVLVECGPVQQLVTRGDAVDLDAIPAPTWTPGRDAGPYLSAAAVITRDPDTGVQNVASYRVQVHDRRTLGLFFGSRLQHGAQHLARWAARGEPMPVALMVGGPPVVNFAAAAKTAYGVDEMGIAGGLAGAPLEVVRGQSVDLHVPARAEMVIEGLVRPGVQRLEGPFGEALGYMNHAAPALVIEVTAICRREDAVHHGYVQQLPPSDGHLVMELGVLGPLWYYLTRKLRLPGLRDLAILPGSAGVAALVVQLERSPDHDAARLGKALAKMNFGQKFIYLVDDDVDIRDLETVNWVISARVDPARDIVLVDGTSTFQYDPAVIARAVRDGVELGQPPYRCSLAIVDATIKCTVPEVSLPARAAMDAAAARWGELGLPPIVPRPRLRRLLDRAGVDADATR